MFGTGIHEDWQGDATQRTVDRVRATAIVELDGASFPELDHCVTEAVRTLSGGTVSGFVPLLAIRHVRCCIAAGSCDCGAC